MFARLLESQIRAAMGKGKALVVYGPRQVGKTTLVRKIGESEGRYLYLNCDEPDVRTWLTDRNSSELKRLIGDYPLVIIDEGQRVPNIGITLKLIVDNHLTKQVLATGSSSFELANRIHEPLTGRKIVFKLFPLTFSEVALGCSLIENQRLIDELTIYGSYPAVTTAIAGADKQFLLKELTESTLFKDIFEFQKIRNPQKVRDLLRALAFQIGNEVSYNELSNLISVDRQTIEHYVNLLEQNFIIYRLPPLTSNRRKEISKLRKIYFVDNGIRNSLINRLEDFKTHPDRGALWEAWAIGERIKTHQMQGDSRKHYFWRRKSGAEIDLVEEIDGRFKGFEYKVGSRKVSAPESWSATYPGATWRVIRPETFEEAGLKD